jgi:hypothetical protein
MRQLVRLEAAGLAVVAVLVLGLVGAPAAGAASTTVHLNDTVDAQTTLATLDQTVVFPSGSFVGGVNFMNGKLKGNLKLPDATTTVSIAGIGLATATIAVVPTTAVVGKFNFKTNYVRATSVFNVHIVSVTPENLSVNLAGDRCTTSTPVTLAFGGTVLPFDGGTVAGTYTMPKLAHCEAITAALNAVLAGPGNTFSALMKPS